MFLLSCWVECFSFFKKLVEEIEDETSPPPAKGRANRPRRKPALGRARPGSTPVHWKVHVAWRLFWCSGKKSSVLSPLHLACSVHLANDLCRPSNNRSPSFGGESALSRTPPPPPFTCIYRRGPQVLDGGGPAPAVGPHLRRRCRALPDAEPVPQGEKNDRLCVGSISNVNCSLLCLLPSLSHS